MKNKIQIYFFLLNFFASGYGYAKISYDAKLECMIGKTQITVGFDMDTVISEHALEDSNTTPFYESNCSATGQGYYTYGVILVFDNNRYVIYKNIVIFSNEFGELVVNACLPNQQELLRFVSGPGGDWLDIATSFAPRFNDELHCTLSSFRSFVK